MSTDQHSPPDAAMPEPTSNHAGVDLREQKYRHDAANYVGEMLAELRQIASAAGPGKALASIDEAYYQVHALLGPETIRKVRRSPPP